MPFNIKTTEMEFLTELNAWIERGKPAYQFADLKGIHPSTITGRLDRCGLEMVRAEGLRHKFTGRMFAEMVQAREYQVIDAEPEPAEVAA